MGRWAILKHPDDPDCTEGQFACPTPQVVFVLEIARPGQGEWIKVEMLDESGNRAVGWVGRWHVQSGSADMVDMFEPVQGFELLNKCPDAP